MINDKPLRTSITMNLSKSFQAVISPEDAALADCKWCACVGRKRVYAYRAERGNNKKKLYLGRVILEAMLGRPLTKGESCLYVDGNPLNNLRENLSLKSSNKLAMHSL